MPGNNSGRRQPGNSAVPSTVGRLGVDGFWVGDYGVGVRVSRPVGAQLEGGQRSYTQFQNVGIKNKLNAEALHMAQLTPPSWRVGAACDPRVTLRRIRSSSLPSILLLRKTPIKHVLNIFFLFLDSFFTEVLVAFQITARKLRVLSLTDTLCLHCLPVCLSWAFLSQPPQPPILDLQYSA